MDVVFVILFVLTVFMLSMYSRFKRILAEQEGIQEEAAHAAATSEEGRHTFGEPYFTYETVEEPQPSRQVYTVKSSTSVSSIRNEDPTPISDIQFRPDFDIRQAIIGQVILNNPYIKEVNQ